MIGNNCNLLYSFSYKIIVLTNTDIMIKSFTCSCGNTDPKKAKIYEGCLGYEALVCTCCGKYYDNEGEHQADKWSTDFIGKPRIYIRRYIYKH